MASDRDLTSPWAHSMGPSVAPILAWPVIRNPLFPRTSHPQGYHALQAFQGTGIPTSPVCPLLWVYLLWSPYTPSRPPTTVGTLPPAVCLPTGYDAPALWRLLPARPGTVNQLWLGQPSRSVHCPVGCSHTISSEVWSTACRERSVSSVTQSCPTLCNLVDCSMPGFSVHHQLKGLLKLMSIKLVMPSNHLILCHPFLLLSSIFPSIRVFSS